MPNKQMYFTDSLYLKLAEEDNASALVSKLLEEHYNTVLSTPENLAKLAKLEQHVFAQTKEIQAKKDELLKEEQTKAKLKAEKEEEQAKKRTFKEKLSEMRMVMRGEFDKWLTKNPKQKGRMDLDEFISKYTSGVIK